MNKQLLGKGLMVAVLASMSLGAHAAAAGGNGCGWGNMLFEGQSGMAPHLARFLHHYRQHSAWHANGDNRTEQGPVLRRSRTLEGRMSGDVRPSFFLRVPRALALQAVSAAALRCCRWRKEESAGACGINGTGGIRGSSRAPAVEAYRFCVEE